MSCPTCGHAMENHGRAGSGGHVFHCPRCGTLSLAFDAGCENYTPKLVEGCREFRRTLDVLRTKGDPFPRALWVGLWIDESIYLPADRPA